MDPVCNGGSIADRGVSVFGLPQGRTVFAVPQDEYFPDTYTLVYSNILLFKHDGFQSLKLVGSCVQIKLIKSY